MAVHRSVAIWTKPCKSKKRQQNLARIRSEPKRVPTDSTKGILHEILNEGANTLSIVVWDGNSQQSNTITINYLPALEITVHGPQTMYERAYKAVVFDASSHRLDDGSVVSVEWFVNNEKW